MSGETPPWLQDDNENNNGEEQDEEEKDEKDRRRRKGILLGLCCCCLLLAIAAAVFLILWFVVFKKEKDPPQQSTTFVPTNCLAWKDLPPYSQNAILPSPAEEPSSSSISSPQYQAFDWLCNDPNLETYSVDRRLERYSLAVLYFGLGGKNWRHVEQNTTKLTNWLSYPTHECNWNYLQGEKESYGAKCDDTPNEKGSSEIETTTAKRGNHQSNKNNIFQHHADKEEEEILKRHRYRHRSLQASSGTSSSSSITTLQLDQNNLIGSLPLEIQLLSKLRVLNLGNNQVYGTTIPIFLTRSLTHLNLTNNRFNGTLTSKSSMFLLHLSSWLFYSSSSSINDPLPLEVLDLSSNQFSGSIVLYTSYQPSSSLIRILSLRNNSITGSLPSQFGILAKGNNLEVLQLDHNQFMGTLPSQLALLNQSLKSLWLNDNEFLKGTIPIEWNNLATSLGGGNNKLQNAHLQNTSLTGIVPKDLCSIEVLQYDCGPLCGCDDCTCGSGGDASNNATTTAAATNVNATEEEEPSTPQVDDDDSDNNNTTTNNNATTTPTNANATDAPTTTTTTNPEVDAAGNNATMDATVNATTTTTTNATQEGNATTTQEQQNLTEPLDFGLVERYSLRLLNYSWNNNRFLINYRGTDYILDDSISYVVYDGQGCRNGDGGAIIVDNPDQYLLVDIQAPADGTQPNLTNQGKGTRSPYRLEVRLNRTTIDQAPFFVPTGDNVAELNFCFGLRINYNQVDGWNQELEATAAEHSIEMRTDLSDRKKIEYFRIRRSTYVP